MPRRDETPPAPEPSAALVERLVAEVDGLVDGLTGEVRAQTGGWLRPRLDAIVTAARAEGLDGLRAVRDRRRYYATAEAFDDAMLEAAHLALAAYREADR
jgi:hypothetical protein